MSSTADDGSISMVVEFTCQGVSYEEATKLLRISNYDVETAVGKYYDTLNNGGEGAIKKLLEDMDTTWDGSAFAADRNGVYDSTSGIPTFNIEYAPGVDNYPHSGGPSVAPTRPNSAASHRSGTSAQAGDAPRPSIESGQESGVTGNSKPVFGPATKEYYDQASWALVPATKTTEYIPDASIFHQSRDPNMPAFIKPLPNQDFLPALITILHTIPMFRNALLAPQVSADNYWLGEDWWKGNASAATRTVDSGSGTEPFSGLDIIYEVQRLMAFLDSTDRAYASLDSLFQLDAWRESQLSLEEPTNDDLLKFLLRWSWAYEKHLLNVRLDGSLRSAINVGGMRQSSFVLDATVMPREKSTERTLYDILDQTLFVSELHSAHIVDISDVLILRLASSKEGAKLECEIPATLYADRYLEVNRAPIDEMFAEMKQYQEHLTKIDLEVEKLKFHKPQKTAYAQSMDTLTMLKTSMKAFASEVGDEIENPQHSAILAQLESLYQNIERKLLSLEEEKKKIRDALDGISDRYRAPKDEGAQADAIQEGSSQSKFAHPYKLWGVATSSLDYYVLTPVSKSNESNEPDELDAKQWWHIKYSYEGDDASIAREQVTHEEVLRDANSDSGRALLVYANDAATSITPIPLSAPLEKFIKKDNFSFLQDLSQREQQWSGDRPDDGNKVIGNWMDEDPPGYDSYNDGYNWSSMSARDFHEQADSGMSSTTLTPNTEVDDDSVGMEMQEVNGGIAAWAGVSNTSSDTISGDAMDTSGSQRRQGTWDIKDVEMSDAEAVEKKDEPSVHHIEMVEKKGG